MLDMTGLKASYDLTLDWVPEQRVDAPVATGLLQGPTMVSAVDEQLGLKLEARKAPIEILVVDRAEKVPTGN